MKNYTILFVQSVQRGLKGYYFDISRKIDMVFDVIKSVNSDIM